MCFVFIFIANIFHLFSLYTVCHKAGQVSYQVTRNCLCQSVISVSIFSPICLFLYSYKLFFSL